MSTAKETCNQHLKGKCNRGDSCKYSHAKPTIPWWDQPAPEKKAKGTPAPAKTRNQPVPAEKAQGTQAPKTPWWEQPAPEKQAECTPASASAATTPRSEPAKKHPTEARSLEPKSPVITGDKPAKPTGEDRARLIAEWRSRYHPVASSESGAVPVEADVHAHAEEEARLEEIDAALDDVYRAQEQDEEQEWLELELNINLEQQKWLDQQIFDEPEQSTDLNVHATVFVPSAPADTRRAELETLKLTSLQCRAKEAGVDERELEDAMDGDTPKPSIIELIVAQQAPRHSLTNLSADANVHASTTSGALHAVCAAGGVGRGRPRTRPDR